jgi:hypothetical protein
MRSRSSFAAIICILGLTAAACNGSNPTAPGGSVPTAPSYTIPNVAGSYSGTTTISRPELGETLTCATTTTVTQGPNGQLSIAPAQLGAPCSTTIPVGEAQIDQTGAFLGQTTGRVTISCGTYDYAFSGGFFGRSLQATYAYTSRTCWNMNVTFNLSRN